MGNAKSKDKRSNKFGTDISRNLTQSSKLSTVSRTKYCKDGNKVIVGGTTTTNTASSTEVGPILVDVRNTATKTTVNSNIAVKDPQDIQYYNRNQRQQKAADNSVPIAVAEQQNLKQAFSFWSLSSLNWNISYSGRSSYRQRQKSFKKEFSTLQYQRKRSKTQWHKPVTNAIFSSHFKESSRSQEFHIDQLVAKGAFGVVFKVIGKKPVNDEQQQQQQKDQQLITPKTSFRHLPVYALKVLKKSEIINANSLQQLKDEVDIQKLCGHHPFIVEQIDLWQNRYNLHILSEYIPNGELFSTIRTFSLNLIRLYLAEIALALDFLHNAGIIYRDAKPENILLTQNFHLKLTDFGLSKWLKLGLTTKTMCGTFQYMAPEILRGEPYTHAVDWWSLGIIVCQMFVERSPDIRQFITVNLPPHLHAQYRYDKSEKSTTNNGTEFYSDSNSDSTMPVAESFLPQEVESLCHEAKDVLMRLLEFDAQKRLRSVRALQRIALYKNFKIEVQHCLKIHPLDIITADNIVIKQNHQPIENSFNTSNAFNNF